MRARSFELYDAVERRWNPRKPIAVLAILTALLGMSGAAASPVVVILDEWSGVAALPCPACPPPAPAPAGTLADIRTFTLPHLGQGTLTVSIDWTDGPVSDLDLYLYRAGVLVASSTADQTIGGAAAVEHIELHNPPSGTYQVHVVNSLSLETAYEGQALFWTTG